MGDRKGVPIESLTRGELTRVGSPGVSGPCEDCLRGDHYLCVGVACWRCPPENHRRVGVSHTNPKEGS